MAKPPEGTGINSRHVLKTKTRECVFVWVGNGWSTPGTGWHTGVAQMAALGWMYVGPEGASE